MMGNASGYPDASALRRRPIVGLRADGRCATRKMPQLIAGKPRVVFVAEMHSPTSFRARPGEVQCLGECLGRAGRLRWGPTGCGWVRRTTQSSSRPKNVLDSGWTGRLGCYHPCAKVLTHTRNRTNSRPLLVGEGRHHRRLPNAGSPAVSGLGDLCGHSAPQNQ